MLDRNLDFRTNATVNLSCAIATSLGALALALHGAGIWALIVAKILGVALPALVLAVVRPWFIARIPDTDFHFVLIAIFH
ncbi:MAG: oligosaccharide flippase family protein [Methylococcales bacterium]